MYTIANLKITWWLILYYCTDITFLLFSGFKSCDESNQWSYKAMYNKKFFSIYLTVSMCLFQVSLMTWFPLWGLGNISITIWQKWRETESGLQPMWTRLENESTEPALKPAPFLNLTVLQWWDQNDGTGGRIKLKNSSVHSWTCWDALHFTRTSQMIQDETEACEYYRF